MTTPLWPHQEESVARVVAGVEDGRRGHADASAVGAGKTLTALATVVRLAEHLERSGAKRNGALIMLPTKALIKEWLLEIAAHTSGFHVIEQREDGSLFSLTYGHKTPPIDASCLVISTLDRVCEHPFVRQAAWDFVVIDECLAVQNAAAKRCPSAWRQIEVSACGVLMLSATFFRSKYDSLFYMIRMLRSPLPRTMEWLPATIHEHIVCQVPETDRTWKMRGEAVPLPAQTLKEYRACIEAFKRRQLNSPSDADGRKLCTELEAFLRERYEGRGRHGSANVYESTSVMGDAFAREARRLLGEGRRPLLFADTQHEAEHLLSVLRASGVKARTWSEVASQNVNGRGGASAAGKAGKGGGGGAGGADGVIVAVKSVEGQGINMQHAADTIVCRPTPGDHLEQMKGRVDRPGQSAKELTLVVLMAEHTLEEAKFANIRLAGSFFREYIAPVASRYREKIDLEATLVAGGSGKLAKGAVGKAWHASLEAAATSGTFACSFACDEKANQAVAAAAGTSDEGSGGSGGSGGSRPSRRKAGAPQDDQDDEDDDMDDDVDVDSIPDSDADEDDVAPRKKAKAAKAAAAPKGKAKAKPAAKGRGKGKGKAAADDDDDDADSDFDEAVEEEEEEEEEEPKYKPLNTVIRNKGDPEAVKRAKDNAKAGKASLAVRRWLFKPKDKATADPVASRKRAKLAEFSDATPPLVLTRDVLEEGIAHLSRVDPKLEALIARIGADALAMDVGVVRPPTQARLFDKLLKSITFTQVSVDAGYAFLRRTAIKIGVCLEAMAEAERALILATALAEYAESGEVDHVRGGDHLVQLLLRGGGQGGGCDPSDKVIFTAGLVGALTATCERIKVTKGKNKGKMELSGYPHLCGKSFPCGKHDNPADFLRKAREHANDGDYSGEPVSAGYSAPKASFLVKLVADFASGRISGAKLAAASDREAMRMLCEVHGVGDWSACGVLMHWAQRADLIMYGDLTIRNYLNDLYDIGHKDESETLLQSAADFPDSTPNRNLIDDVAERNHWAPYRSLVCFLMYALQEDNLVLL